MIHSFLPNHHLLQSRPAAKRRRPRVSSSLWLICRAPAFAAALLSLSLLARNAGAAGAHRVVVEVKGASAETIRAQVIAALPAGIEVSQRRNVISEESRQALFDHKGDSGDNRLTDVISELHRAGRTNAIDAVILGETRAVGGKGARELQLIVVLTAPGGRVTDETALLRPGSTLPARLKTSLVAAVESLREDAGAGDADGARPPASADGQPRAEGGSDAVDGVAARSDRLDSVSPTEALLVGFVGPDFGGRQFHYNQRITNANLRPYDLPQAGFLPASPGVAAAVELYPFARSAGGVARDIGVGVQGGYNLAKAQIGDVKLDTRWYAWEVDLRGRWHLGPRGASPVIGLEGGFGRHVFEFSNGNGVADLMPGVDYHYLRFGLDGRMPIGKGAVIARVAYRHLLTQQGPMGATVVAAGSVGDHFPRADMAGIDARLGGALSLAHNVEARLLVTYVRYWATFNPRPGDTYIAGGAIDQFINADLAIAMSF